MRNEALSGGKMSKLLCSITVLRRAVLNLPYRGRYSIFLSQQCNTGQVFRMDPFSFRAYLFGNDDLLPLCYDFNQPRRQWISNLGVIAAIDLRDPVPCNDQQRDAPC